MVWGIFHIYIQCIILEIAWKVQWFSHLNIIGMSSLFHSWDLAHRELSWAEPRWAFRLIIWWAELSRAELDSGSPKWAELSWASAHPSELSWAGHRLTPPELSWAFDRLSSAQLKICLINSWLSSAHSSWAFRLTLPSLLLAHWPTLVFNALIKLQFCLFDFCYFS